MLGIEAEFTKLKVFIFTSFTPAEIDMNPEIMQEISLIEAKLRSALELARAKHRTQIEREKTSILKEIIEMVSKLIEKLRLS
ncbi:MAG: hypothetical protein H0Z28_03415 [Archaeoglobus sp.]|nr:hypothetical protein [Archaeoglobus sp.]